MKKNQIVLLAVVILTSLALYNIFVKGNEEVQYETEFKASGYASARVLDAGITDRETALRHGVKGYISVEPKEPGKKTLDLSDRKEIVLPLLVKMISYDESLTQATVHIDPQNPYTLIVDQGVGKGLFIRFNDYVKYDLTGDVIIKAGEALEVKMRVQITQSFPHFKLPLYIVGIESDLPVIYNVEGEVIG